MQYKYNVCLTNLGRAKIAECISNKQALELTHMSVGDSNGVSYNPSPEMNSLKNEVYKATIDSYKQGEDPNTAELELVIPVSSGGYYVREAGLYDKDDVLIAIARLPEQYKALSSEGAGSNMTIRMIIAFSSYADITINVPVSNSYATQTYVQAELSKHIADDNAHAIYVKQDEFNESLAGKSDTNHQHSNYITNDTVIPINKGGTGANKGENFRNALSIEQFRDVYRLGSKLYTTGELFEKLIARGENIVVTVMNINNSLIGDLPFSSGNMDIRVFNGDNAQFLVRRARGFEEYQASVDNRRFLGWKLLRGVDGIIPQSAGGSGISAGAIPNIVKTEQLDLFSGSASIGTCVFWDDSGKEYRLPNGGSWFVVNALKGVKSNITAFVRPGGFLVSSGGDFNRYGYAIKIR